MNNPIYTIKRSDKYQADAIDIPKLLLTAQSFDLLEYKKHILITKTVDLFNRGLVLLDHEWVHDDETGLDKLFITAGEVRKMEMAE